MATKAKPRTLDPLVGKYFHIFGAPRKVEYQGHVVARISEGLYLVQAFDWMLGEPSQMFVVSANQMVITTPMSRENGTWAFYPNAEAMNGWYETWNRREGETNG